MAVPKRKKSKARVRSRKASRRAGMTVAQKFAKCGSPHLPHRVCPSCGYYRGRQVVTVDVE